MWKPLCKGQLKEDVRDCFKNLTPNDYAEGGEKLLVHHDKCFILNSNNVPKIDKISKSVTKTLLFIIFNKNLEKLTFFVFKSVLLLKV